MIENVLWMLEGGSNHRDDSFEHPKQVFKLKLIHGIVSLDSLNGGRFSYLQMKEKNVLDAHGGRPLWRRVF